MKCYSFDADKVNAADNVLYEKSFAADKVNVADIVLDQCIICKFCIKKQSILLENW